MNIKSKIKTVSIDSVKPYENNAKIHTTKQIRMIAESMEKFGNYNPIICDKKLNIIAGHGRFEACKINGYKKIDIICLDDLKPVQVKKLRLLDNKIISTDFDDDKLLSEVESIYKDLEKNSEKILNEINVDIVDYLSGDEEVFDDLNSEMAKASGMDDCKITLIVPAKYEAKVKKFLAGREKQTARGMGKGVLKKCKLR